LRLTERRYSENDPRSRRKFSFFSAPYGHLFVSARRNFWRKDEDRQTVVSGMYLEEGSNVRVNKHTREFKKRKPNIGPTSSIWSLCSISQR